jgi:hypothetical protein
MGGLVPAQSKPRLLPVHHQRAISTAHSLPVIFKRSSTNDTDLIVLSIATESWPSKAMGARFADESLQECHVSPSLSQEQASALRGCFAPQERFVCRLCEPMRSFDGGNQPFQQFALHHVFIYQPQDSLRHLGIR